MGRGRSIMGGGGGGGGGGRGGCTYTHIFVYIVHYLCTNTIALTFVTKLAECIVFVLLFGTLLVSVTQYLCFLF
jgi:hypothetical protein